MHWHDAAALAAKSGNFLLRIVWDPDSDGFPNLDVARNIAFTLATFVLGWASSLNVSKRRLKARVIDELILCQSELFARAYPAHWSADRTKREGWMIDPYVARLRFLYAGLNEQKSLSRKQLDRIEWYIMRVDEFAKAWVQTEKRYEPFHQAYKLTYNGARLALQDLGLKQMRRLNGLASPKDGLFGGGASPSPAPAAPQTAPSGPRSAPGLLPAE